METGKINPLILKSIKTAREIREANFPGQIFFSRPKATLPLSITGSDCALNCAHCGGNYLRNMTPLSEAKEKMKKKEIKSCLLSGGCTLEGSIKVDVETIKPVIKGLKVNAHLGLIKEEDFKPLLPYIDCVSFDFLVDKKTIQEVYHLEKSGEDYIKTYKMLKSHTKVIPHICIGLLGGEISGEYDALDTLASLGADSLVFIVFIPTRGTLYANHKPPQLEKVIELFVYARKLFPDIFINLGCMRPQGKYRSELDYYAVECGLNKIVNPTPTALKRAKELGYEIIFEEECCVL